MNLRFDLTMTTYFVLLLFLLLSLSLSLLCRFLKWFKKAMAGVEKHLLRKSGPSKLTFIGEELQSGQFYPKMVSVVNVKLYTSSRCSHLPIFSPVARSNA